MTVTTILQTAHQQIKQCWFLASLTTSSRNRHLCPNTGGIKLTWWLRMWSTHQLKIYNALDVCQKRNKFTADLELIYYIFYNPDEIEERRMWLMKDLFHVKTGSHSYVWQYSSQIYVTLYSTTTLIIWINEKKSQKCSLYRRAQTSFISEFLQTVKKHSLAQLIRICGMLCKSQTKNSLSHAAVAIYFNWPVICAAFGKWETYL